MSKQDFLNRAKEIKDSDVIFDKDSRELTSEDFRNAKTITELPEVARILNITSEKNKEIKKPYSIRLKPSTIEAFKTLGAGYQSRISDLLDVIANDIKNQKKHS